MVYLLLYTYFVFALFLVMDIKPELDEFLYTFIGIPIILFIAIAFVTLFILGVVFYILFYPFYKIFKISVNKS